MYNIRTCLHVLYAQLSLMYNIRTCLHVLYAQLSLINRLHKNISHSNELVLTQFTWLILYLWRYNIRTCLHVLYAQLSLINRLHKNISHNNELVLTQFTWLINFKEYYAFVRLPVCRWSCDSLQIIRNDTGVHCVFSCFVMAPYTGFQNVLYYVFIPWQFSLYGSRIVNWYLNLWDVRFSLRGLRRLLTSRMWCCVVWYKITKVVFDVRG